MYERRLGDAQDDEQLYQWQLLMGSRQKRIAVMERHRNRRVWAMKRNGNWLDARMKMV